MFIFESINPPNMWCIVENVAHFCSFTFFVWFIFFCIISRWTIELSYELGYIFSIPTYESKNAWILIISKFQEKQFVTFYIFYYFQSINTIHVFASLKWNHECMLFLREETEIHSQENLSWTYLSLTFLYRSWDCTFLFSPYLK